MFLRAAQCAFLVLLFVLPLVRCAPPALQDHGLEPADVVFVITALLWGIALARREVRLHRAPIHACLGLYFASLVLSTVFTTDPDASWHKLPGHAYLIGLCVLSFELLDETFDLRIVTRAFLAGSAVASALSIVGLAAFLLGFRSPESNGLLYHLGSLPPGDFPRVRSSFANANMFCNYLNVSAMLLAASASNGWLGRRATIALASITGVAAVLTISPGLGGIALSLGAWGRASARSRGRSILAKTAAVAGTLVAALFLVVTVVSPDTPNTNLGLRVPGVDMILEPSVRVLVWHSTLRTIAAYPVFGLGVGTGPAHLEYVTLAGEAQVLVDAHQVWLSVLGQTGLVGLAAFALLIAYVSFGAARFTWDVESDDARTLVALSCALLGAFWFQGLSGSFEDARQLWILFGLIVGARTAVDRRRGGKPAREATTARVHAHHGFASD